METTPQLIVLVPSSDWIPSNVVVWRGSITHTSEPSPDPFAAVISSDTQALVCHHADAQIHTKCHLHQLQAF